MTVAGAERLDGGEKLSLNNDFEGYGVFWRGLLNRSSS